MRFSVVIPTYNRSEKIPQCLEALFAQKFNKKKYEVIFVDDGSTDDTQKVVERLSKDAPVAVSVIKQKNQGQGVARNRGVEEAQGEIVLFIGDDIVATPTLLAEHDKIHAQHPERGSAGLGFVTWHPKLIITNLMRFMERGGAVLGRWGGHQFAYDLLEGKQLASYRFFYTANISLKRSLLLEHKFDPWFSSYGFEDIELGYRLSKKADLRLWYNPAAIGYHDHPMSFEDFANRMRAIGKASHALQARYPELGAVPSRRKKRIFQLLSRPTMLRFLHLINENFYFYALSKKYFLEGLKEGYNEKDER